LVMAQKTDPELLETFRERGDITGFNELLRRYQEKVYWTARRILGTHEDADDAVQDVFIKVYERLNEFRGDSNFYTWLYRITVNVSLNMLRKKRLKQMFPFDMAAEETLAADSETDGDLQNAEYRTLLEKAVQRLPVKQRMVFIMRYYDEMPYEEMSKVLKKSLGGLKANYFHAVKKISKYIRKEMGL